MDIISGTGIGIKVPGDSFTSEEFNSINSTVNATVDGINEFLKDFCNVNSEINDFTKKMSLSNAAGKVPEKRRRFGLKIRFLGSSGEYLEYIYNGPSLEETDWTKESNWRSPYTVIDGGEW